MNFLIIFSTGIYIYNSQLLSEIRNITFESDFSIGENDLNLINLAKFIDGVVICIIKTLLYIFSSSGEYIHHFDLNDDLQNAYYYSLVPHKIDNNKYYYAIIYMDSSKLNIYYYNININDNSNNRINYLQYIHTDSSYNIYSNNGVTCELMSPLNSENVLTCFYEVSLPNSLAATSFILDNPISISNSIPIIYK